MGRITKRLAFSLRIISWESHAAASAALASDAAAASALATSASSAATRTLSASFSASTAATCAAMVG